METFKVILYIKANNRDEANRELQQVIGKLKKSERARKANREIRDERDKMTDKQRTRVLERDKYTCQKCGGKAPDVELQIDHIKTIKDGGKSTDDNLITLCDRCNYGKKHI